MPDTPLERLTRALADRYAIAGELGEGGMATVYLADDLKHGRKVALKVLKPELAAVVGAERFLSEIRTTANLQHPHILPLFDSGEADSFLFYVMPYVEGETLRDRLDREKQLPVDEAVAIARAVAQALQHAHDRGVIHRDIKPGNILLQDGQPVVADFGIALAVGAGGGARLTETGLSVGTPYYMSPEQATGDRQVGPASDTYSLAAVLYEMLVGDPPYTGSTAQAVLGKIIQGAPVSATQIRHAVPANVDAAVQKALEKLPADRFTRVRDFAAALTDPAFRHGAGIGGDAGGDARRWRVIAGAATALLVLTAAWSVWSAVSATPEAPRPVARFASPFQVDQAPVGMANNASFALSPDGSTLVYRSRQGDEVSLMVRRWSDLEATPLRGSADAQGPDVSPDGADVAYTVSDPARGVTILRVASLAGGNSRDVYTDSVPFLSRWGADGFIYLSGRRGGILRIRPEGGEPTVLDEGADNPSLLWQVLPGNRWALAWQGSADGPALAAIDLETGDARPLGAQGGIPQFLPPGYLLYWTLDSTVVAAPFDPDRAEITGDGVPLMRGVYDFDVTADGTLFYWGPRPIGTRREFIWVSRSGQVTPVEPGWTFDMGGSGGNVGWSLSPDGKRLAFREWRDGNFDIWIKELDDGPLSRLTFDPREDRMPRWTPDGTRVVFLSARGGSLQAYSRAADGTGDADSLFAHTQFLAQAVPAPRGDWLILRTGGSANILGGRDILAVRPGVDSVATPLLTTPYDEASPSVSPDGRWLAYGSRETGTWEVYVRPFPDVNAGKWQVSTGGGVQPVWGRSAPELFYVTPDAEMVAARYEGSTSFRVTARSTLFAAPAEATLLTSAYFGKYDVSPDGQRFLMARTPPGTEDERRVDAWVLVQNVGEEIRRLVGSGGER